MYLKGEIILLPFILQAKILAKDIERAGAKYYESKVLGTDKKNIKTGFSGRYSLLCHLCQENPI